MRATTDRGGPGRIAEDIAADSAAGIAADSAANSPFRAPRAPAVVVGGARRVGLLERALRPLTVLLSPAGAGKTAALAHWASSRPQPPLWLDGRRSDHRAALVGASDQDWLDAVVVIDDAHELSCAELEAVVRIAGHDGARIVLAARRDLSLPVVELKLSDRLVVLRGDHLRLTEQESRELVRAHAPDADAEDVETVARRADGWAAAAVLAAQALASAADRDTARAALVAADQPVLDYLLDEVVATLPATTQHVLLCTADEQRVTPLSGEILSGDPAAGARLAQLAVDGMFVVMSEAPEGGQPQWTYHPLLRQLLRRQVAPGMPDAELGAAAHRRAAHIYAATHDTVPALHHAVASTDPGLVLELLTRLAPRTLAAERIAGVRTPGHEHEALLLTCGPAGRGAGDGAVPEALDLPRPQPERAGPRSDVKALTPVPALTAREVDVLRGLAKGESYLDIAQDLYITQNTVKTHVTALYRKLNVSRRPDALRTARRLGLLQDATVASPVTDERPA